MINKREKDNTEEVPQERSLLEAGFDSEPFHHLIGEAAFIDRITVSIADDNKKRGSSDYLRNPENIPIGGPGSLFGRLLRGHARDTNNPVALKYSPLKKFNGRVPDMMLDMRSEAVPVTGVQVLHAIAHFAPSPQEAWVSELELTFDLPGIMPEFLSRLVFTRKARSFTLRDNVGRATVYFGTRNSDWQIRIYSKAGFCCRCEFVFRRPFLLARNIRSVTDVLALRTTDLTKLASFQCLNPKTFEAALSLLCEEKAEMLRRSAVRYLQPATEVFKELGIKYRITRDAPQQKLISRMQQNLVW